MKDISRRDFLKYLGVGTLGLIAKPKIPFAEIAEGFRSSDVIQCFHEDATTGNTINQAVVQIMMDESIKHLTGIDEVGEAWKSIFPGIIENNIIGIKVNVINEYLPTHREFVNCIVNGLAQMEFNGSSFRKNNIIIWDRTDWELTDAGYTIYTGNDPNTPRCFGTNHSGIGYDYAQPLNVNGVNSYPSTILSEMSDYLINAAVLKNHDTAQVTLCMKNHYGTIHNPGSLHGGWCNPYLPSLSQQIRDVITPNNIQRIFIVDSLWGSILAGPGGSPNCTPNKLLMSLDTVACDYRGWELINEERVAHGWNPISWPIHHIETAAQPPYDLGSTDVNLIEINNPSQIKEFETVTPSRRTIQIAPNPFRENTTIAFSMPKASPVHIDLVDAAGRIRDRIFAGDLPHGQHRINYRLQKRLTSGSYFVRLYRNGESIVRKITILN